MTDIRLLGLFALAVVLCPSGLLRYPVPPGRFLLSFIILFSFLSFPFLSSWCGLLELLHDTLFSLFTPCIIVFR